MKENEVSIPFSEGYFRWTLKDAVRGYGTGFAIGGGLLAYGVSGLFETRADSTLLTVLSWLMIAFGVFVIVFFAELILRNVSRKDSLITSSGVFGFHTIRIKEEQIEGVQVKSNREGKPCALEFLVEGKRVCLLTNSTLNDHIAKTLEGL